MLVFSFIVVNIFKTSFSIRYCITISIYLFILLSFLVWYLFISFPLIPIKFILIYLFTDIFFFERIRKQLRPRTWSQALGQEFELVTDEQRNSALTSCLPNDVLLIVHDLLINEPSYQTIKQRLIQWFEPNLSSRVSELLSYPTVAEERPSRFLLTLRTKLAQGDMSEDMIRELFIAKMPDHLRNSLIAMRTASLDELAITADKMVCNRKDSFSKHSLYSVNQKSESFSEDNVSFQIKSLENKLNNVLELVKGSNSFSTTKPTSYNQKPARGDRTNKWHSQATGNPQRQSQHVMCWYHLTFGDRARKCSPPCTFVVSGNEPRPLQQR